MYWQLSEDDIVLLTGQQKTNQRYQLARHLLTLENPPKTWEECELWLSHQIRLAAEYQIHHVESLTQFIEAIYLVPEALKHSQVQKYLRSEALESFRTECMLNWARETYQKQKEKMTPPIKSSKTPS